ncbi:MAG: hypothetical protein Q9195_004720 [Heterodermia aff. obscurata]
MENYVLTDVHINVLTATASQLQQRLRNGSLTSAMIVEAYLAQIKRHNHAGAHLNAMISVPESQILLSTARSLDAERTAGQVRGPLHGIPIILKDAITTSLELGMGTTVGSYALEDSIPVGNADIVDAVRSSNFVALSMLLLPASWTALKTSEDHPAGQQSAYIRGGKAEGEKPSGETSPGGSSTGSAQGVAAGFAPLSIGTETIGSLTTPAGRAALYALKLTPGSTSPNGIFRVTETFVSIGAMSQTVEDIAILSDILRESPQTSSLEVHSLRDELGKKWDDISIGFVDIEEWRLMEKDKDFDAKYNAQTKREYETMIHRIRNLGGRVVHPITLPKYNELTYKGTDLVMATTREILFEVNSEFPLSSYFRCSKAPGQQDLENILQSNVSEHELSELLDNYYRITATDGIDQAMHKHKLDLVAGPADSTFVTLATGSLRSLAALQGYPIAAVPLGYVESSGRPYGAQLIVKAGGEATLIGAMSAWERMMPARRAPDLSWAGAQDSVQAPL